MSPTAGAGPHFGLRRYWTDRLGLGLDGTLLWWGDGSTDDAPGWTAAANLSWVPWATDPYRLSPDSGRRVVGPSVDLHVGAGGGVLARRNRGVPVVPRAALDAFVGLRFFVNRWFAITLDARAYATIAERPVDFFGTLGVAFLFPSRVLVEQ
ncbi:MAG: hypothetical protein KF819_05810 [Labilithrix sp.]|nr:hypothetical protein [Labilithrix sp.]